MSQSIRPRVLEFLIFFACRDDLQERRSSSSSSSQKEVSSNTRIVGCERPENELTSSIQRPIRTQKVHHRIATKFDSEPQKKGRSKASLHSKAREKTKTSASRRSELDIDEILDSFQENVQGMYENFTSNLQSHVDANKRRLNRFQADSQKSIQKVSQQTIHALNVFGQLEVGRVIYSRLRRIASFTV